MSCKTLDCSIPLETCYKMIYGLMDSMNTSIENPLRIYSSSSLLYWSTSFHRALAYSICPFVWQLRKAHDKEPFLKISSCGVRFQRLLKRFIVGNDPTFVLCLCHLDQSAMLGLSTEPVRRFRKNVKIIRWHLCELHLYHIPVLKVQEIW